MWCLLCHYYLCKDGCVKDTHFVVVLAHVLRQPVVSFLVCELCLLVATSNHLYICLISAKESF